MIVLAIPPVEATLCVTRQPLVPSSDWGIPPWRTEPYKRLISLSERDARRVEVGARIAIAATRKKPEFADLNGLRTVLDEDGWWLDDQSDPPNFRAIPLGAIVGSATVEAVVPIVSDVLPSASPLTPMLVTVSARLWLDWFTGNVDESDQLAYDTGLTPGRWAVLLTDAAPTSERCCRPAHERGRWCNGCGGHGNCPPIPYTATGRVGKWTP